MYSHFISYLVFCSTQADQIHHRATLHFVYPILSISCLLMPWRPKVPGHQQAWYWPNKLEYSVSSIRRVTWVHVQCKSKSNCLQNYSISKKQLYTCILRREQNMDGIFKCISLKKLFWFGSNFSEHFFSCGPIDNGSAWFRGVPL